MRFISGSLLQVFRAAACRPKALPRWRGCASDSFIFATCPIRSNPGAALSIRSNIGASCRWSACPGWNKFLCCLLSFLNTTSVCACVWFCRCVCVRRACGSAALAGRSGACGCSTSAATPRSVRSGAIFQTRFQDGTLPLPLVIHVFVSIRSRGDFCGRLVEVRFVSVLGVFGCV